MNEERKRAQKRFLLLDAGNLFISKSKSGCDQRELGKAEQILRSYQSMAYDAINLSQEDLVFGTSFLLKDLLEEARALKLPLISANLVSKKTGKPIFSPYIVKKVGQINVGIFGLMEHLMPAQKTDSTYIVKDPSDAAHEMISSLKGKADLIIALSSLSKEENLKLLEDLSDIDFIISTDRRTHAPIRVKNGYILSSGNKGKYLGRLDITLTSLERPLGLQDVSATRKLRSRLAWVQQKIINLKDRENDVLGTDNARIKERFSKEIERLKKQEGQYRQELAKLDKVSNYFTNATIPLATKRQEKAPKKVSSRHTKRKTAARGASPIMSPGPHIKITTLSADKGQKITLVLLIEKAPNQVRALGFDVVYDPKVLRYSKCVKGELVKRFDMFDASKIKDGQLRVGGFEARDDLIVAGKSGELVRLHFEVIGKGNSDLRLVMLKDDISSWVAEEAQFSRKKNREDYGQLKRIKVESIWSHPEIFLGQKVLVRGTYLGWRGQIEHPQITRSDWAIEDDTGAIYVTGLRAKGLDPVYDIGHPLEVLGTVRINPEGVPYIWAERVIVVPSRHSEEGMTTVTKGDGGKTIEVAVNDLLQIELLGTPTTGFWWYFEGLDEEYMELVKEYTKESFSGKIEGGPILGIWQLMAKKAGMTTIKMAYYRSWEGSDKQLDQFWIRLKITSNTLQNQAEKRGD